MEEFDLPAPRDGDMVVEIGLGGVCGTDLHLTQGHLSVPTPLVVGGVDLDGLGQPLHVGDPVSWSSNIPCGRCYYCEHGREPTLCNDRKVYGVTRGAEQWPHLSGTWADHIYLEAGTTVVRLADELDPLDVIALGCAGPTVVHALRLTRVNVGSYVVVQGAGPVGIAAAIYSRVAGAGAVIMVGGPAARLETAREIGAASTYLDIFKLTDPLDRAAAVCALTPRQRGADVVIECTGVPEAVAEALDLVRPGGTIVVLGQYSDAGQAPLNPHLITRKQVRLQGSLAYSARDFLDYISSIPRLTERFELRRLVASYPLEDVGAALADVREGAVVKAALTTRSSVR